MPSGYLRDSQSKLTWVVDGDHGNGSSKDSAAVAIRGLVLGGPVTRGRVGRQPSVTPRYVLSVSEEGWLRFASNEGTSGLFRLLLLFP